MSQQSISDAINEIQASGGFVIFQVDETRNYYVQVSIRTNQSQVYGEAVSNDYIPDDGQLSPVTMSRLEKLGWSQPGGAQSNYSQSWDGEGANAIAEVLTNTLQEVYGWDGSSELGITVERD